MGKSACPARMFSGGVFVSLALVVASGEFCLWAQSGSLDPAFSPGTGANQSVYSIALQSDGLIMIGGDFSNFNGSPRTNIVRLNPVGSVDTNFASASALGGSPLSVNVVGLQPDGKLLLGGSFTGAFGTNLVRLNTNGTVDSSFSAGTDDAVNSLVIQTNGSIVIGGFFSQADNASRNGIARLSSNGILDATFSPSLAGGSSAVYSLALQNDGKIVVAGSFTSVNSTGTTNLVRLNANGTVDTNFRPVSITGQLPVCYAVAIDGQGRVLAGGDFASVNSATHTNLVRLNADGTPDGTFNSAAGTDAAIYSILAQNDGKILLGGLFQKVSSVNQSFLARLNSDGSLDSSFTPGSGPNYVVYSLAQQSDGKLLVGGSFTAFNGTPAGGVVRLQNPPLLFNPTLSGGIFGVSVATFNGRSYVLQFKDSITATSWTALPAMGGDGTIKTLTDPNASGPHRFYRVQQY